MVPYNAFEWVRCYGSNPPDDFITHLHVLDFVIDAALEWAETDDDIALCLAAKEKSILFLQNYNKTI